MLVPKFNLLNTSSLLRSTSWHVFMVEFLLLKRHHSDLVIVLDSLLIRSKGCFLSLKLLQMLYLLFLFVRFYVVLSLVPDSLIYRFELLFLTFLLQNLKPLSSHICHCFFRLFLGLLLPKYIISNFRVPMIPLEASTA